MTFYFKSYSVNVLNMNSVITIFEYVPVHRSIKAYVLDGTYEKNAVYYIEAIFIYDIN